MNKNVEYYALAIDAQTAERTLAVAKPHIPADWKIINHHMTIMHRSRKNNDLLMWIEDNYGKRFEVKVVALGVSNDAIALGIEAPNVPSGNAIKHITIAIPPNGKAVNSNYITNWTPLAEPFSINGTVKAF